MKYLRSHTNHSHSTGCGDRNVYAYKANADSVRKPLNARNTAPAIGASGAMDTAEPGGSLNALAPGVTIYGY
jgi:hypothetical protein